jgi:hypothetical protein
MNAPCLKEEQAEREEGTGRGGADGEREVRRCGKDDRAAGMSKTPQPPRRRIPDHHHEPRGNEQHRDLSPRERRHRQDEGRDHPQPDIALVGEAGELDGGDRDDGHHGRSDAVEDRLH